VGRDPCDTLGQVVSPAARAQCARQGVPANAAFGTFQQRLVARGNPDLDAETAKVETAGVVVEPGRGLTLSVDFWRIGVEQAIQPQALSTIFTNCYERGIQSFCDQVHRNPQLGFSIDFVDGPTLNHGGTSTSGVDAALDLEQRTPGGGLLRARAEVQRLMKFDVDNTITVLNGLGVYDLGVFPKTKANVSASWQQGGMGAGFNFTFVDTFLECDANDCNGGALSRDVGDYQKLDVFGSLRFGRGPGTTLTMGVNNVLDRTPPTIYIGFFGDSDGATYDFLGRMFYARLTQQF
jgi:iron complex outermembrane recepter protein